jgi:hypothetical protein
MAGVANRHRLHLACADGRGSRYVIVDAESVPDLFERLNAAGTVLCLTVDGRPSSIEHVVRLCRVKRITETDIELDGGAMPLKALLRAHAARTGGVVIGRLKRRRISAPWALVLLATACAELTFTAVAVPVTWLILPLLLVM